MNSSSGAFFWCRVCGTLLIATSLGQEHDVTHLVNRVRTLVAQRDQIPGDGRYRKTGQLAAEVILQEYRISILSELRRGPFEIELGVYDPTTGERLPVHDAGGNRLPGDDALLISLEGEPVVLKLAACPGVGTGSPGKDRQ